MKLLAFVILLAPVMSAHATPFATCTQVINGQVAGKSSPTSNVTAANVKINKDDGGSLVIVGSLTDPRDASRIDSMNEGDGTWRVADGYTGTSHAVTRTEGNEIIQTSSYNVYRGDHGDTTAIAFTDTFNTDTLVLSHEEIATYKRFLPFKTKVVIRVELQCENAEVHN